MINAVAFHPNQVNVAESLRLNPIKELVAISGVYIVELIYICTRCQCCFRNAIEIADNGVRNMTVLKSQVSSCISRNQYVASQSPRLEQTLIHILSTEHPKHTLFH